MPKGIPKYTGEFKQEVVEAVMRDKLSYREAARQYGVTNHETIKKWERIYLEEGPEGLHIERRGRACAEGGTQKGRKPKLDQKVEEDLIAEVQRLRAEVAYLKKLNALVAERERHERKVK